MLNSSFNRAESAFLGFLKYALIREEFRSSISDSYIVSRAHKLPCFAQSANFFVHKQTNPNIRRTDQSLYPLCAHGLIHYHLLILVCADRHVMSLLYCTDHV